MYLFQISNYDDPAVDRETAELLHQRLEAESRQRCPTMWNAIDRIRTHAAKGPKGPAREKRKVRYRIYGVFLLALGLLTLILGLMPPRTTGVIIVGGAVIIAGLLEFALARGRTPPRIPASCKKEARKALELQRTVDWEKLKTAIRFEDAGITICTEENEEHLSYTRIKSAFESLHLWLVVCDDERALLLQKKDLRSGNADSFLSDIISKMNTGTDASG